MAKYRRWRVEACNPEDGQYWWSAAPDDNRQDWRDFPRWRQAYEYALSGGVLHRSVGVGAAEARGGADGPS